MADEKKVFDVTKPGSAKPETGSKPMVVGHKMMKDPTLTNSKKSEDSSDEPIAQTSKITINPVSEEFTPETTDETPPESTDQSNDLNTSSTDDDQTSKNVTPDTVVEVDSPATEPVIETTAEEKKEAAVDKRIEQEENLQKIIKEKTYIVPIEEASYSAFKTFMKTFIIVGLLGVIAIVLLIDAEIIDLGITLPFDLL